MEYEAQPPSNANLIGPLDTNKSICVVSGIPFNLLCYFGSETPADINMGNEISRPPTVYGRISKAIPPVAPQYGTNENCDWVDKGVKAFASEGDREQFIYGLISLLTSNGSINVENHDIKLLFSRRQYEVPTPTSPPGPRPSGSKPGWRALVPSSTPEPDDGTRLLATLVAIDETGVIRVKIEPEADGKTVAEAFRLFKRDVELKLERLLRNVPNGTGEAHINLSKGDGRASERARSAPVPALAPERLAREVPDAPPAYVDVKKG